MSLGRARWCGRMRARFRLRSQRASRGWPARQPWLPLSGPSWRPYPGAPASPLAWLHG